MDATIEPDSEDDLDLSSLGGQPDGDATVESDSADDLGLSRPVAQPGEAEEAATEAAPKAAAKATEDMGVEEAKASSPAAVKSELEMMQESFREAEKRIGSLESQLQAASGKEEEGATRIANA